MRNRKGDCVNTSLLFAAHISFANFMNQDELRAGIGQG
jgi:hypothetical protein